MPREVIERQPQQVRRANQHHELNLDEIDSQQDRDDAKAERADDAVLQRFALLPFGKAENENCQHHRVVRAEETFERDQQGDGDEIRCLTVPELLPCSRRR